VSAPLEVQPLRGPLAARRPDGVVLTAPGSRLWQVDFDRNPGDLAIEFDDRFTVPGPGAQLAVWLDDRQVFATAAEWSGATGHHAVLDVSGLDEGQHTLTAVVTPGNGRRGAQAVLGGFEVRSRPQPAAPSDDLSTGAKIALLALLLFAVVALLAWWLRRGERPSVASDDAAADR
jgi:hypothetical protein